MMKNRRLVALVALGLVTVLSFACLTVYADGTNKKSIGSVADDIDAGAEPTGKDESQSKKTVYYDTAFKADTEEGTCEVYATLPSSFSVLIPKVVILAGETNGSGAYTVKVTGDIAGDEKIAVKPAATVLMKQANKADVFAAIAQTKTEWTVASDSDLASGVTTTGTITAAGLTAGQWKGSFNFDIKLTTTTP